jgi:hypothetical protein
MQKRNAIFYFYAEVIFLFALFMVFTLAHAQNGLFSQNNAIGITAVQPVTVTSSSSVISSQAQQSIHPDISSLSQMDKQNKMMTSRWSISEITPDVFTQLDIDEQKQIASLWHLSLEDYGHYLYLMNNTVNGIYYKDRNLDPSWILGFNAKTDSERERFVLIAIQNERLRIAKELLFQQQFTALQKKYYPSLAPIRWNPR